MIMQYLLVPISARGNFPRRKRRSVSLKYKGKNKVSRISGGGGSIFRRKSAAVSVSRD